MRVDFGEDVIFSREKKDIQVAALRDLLQAVNNGENNGAFSFKNTAPPSYKIKTENCGDNAGMVKWTNDHVVTPIAEVTDIKDIYLYGNIVNCRFFVNDEEVAKPDYSNRKTYISRLVIQRVANSHKLRLIHGYVWAEGTSIVLVVHTPNGDVRLTETLQLSNDDNRRAISAGVPLIDDIAWIKHKTGLLRWVVSISNRQSEIW